MFDRIAAHRPLTIRNLSTRTRRFTIGAAAVVPLPSKGVVVEREGPIMAVTIKVPVSRPVRRQHRRFPAPIDVGVALVLAVTAALIFVAVARGLAPAPTGDRTGTPVVVPHPAPGPFGS